MPRLPLLVALTLHFAAQDFMYAHAQAPSISDYANLIAQPSADARAGFRVAVHGDTALLGSEDFNQVSLFRLDADGGWNFSGALQPAGAVNGSNRAFDICDDLMVITSGIHLDLYLRNTSGDWEYDQTLTPRSPAGTSEEVRTTGDMIVVSFPASGQHGQCIVFKRDVQGAWAETQVIDPLSFYDTFYFGYRIALSNDTLLVKGYDASSGAGIVWTYDIFPSGLWLPTQELHGRLYSAFGNFGSGLAIEDDVAVVGASATSEVAPGAGSAFLFARDPSGDWSEVGHIYCPEAVPDARFGWSVDIEWDDVFQGYHVLVGAPSAPSQGTLGKAYYFDLSSTFGVAGWRDLRPTSLQIQDLDYPLHFGWSVALDGPRALVGAPGFDFPAGSLDDRGSAYVFETKTLVADSAQTSISQPSPVTFELRLGPSSADSLFVMGGALNQQPGTFLPGGPWVPLTFDAYTSLTLSPQSPFAPSYGVLNDNGFATTQFNLPIGATAEFAGLNLNHAFIAVDLVTFEVNASNAEILTLKP